MKAVKKRVARKSSPPDKTGKKQGAVGRSNPPAKTQFKPGQSGNPKGRPKGARNKIGEEFLQELLEDWQEHGVEALQKMRTERPHEYVKMIASILPKELATPEGAPALIVKFGDG